jgi:predicted transcriptional regulator
LLVWNDDRCRIIGPLPSTGNKEMFDLAMSRPSITASVAAKALDLKITNASMKLKQLEQHGYLLREEVVSPSGGKEFVYFRIK